MIIVCSPKKKCSWSMAFAPRLFRITDAKEQGCPTLK